MWCFCFCVFLCFFFQAEDGIRDLVRSRGLGDVYKRQQQLHGVDAATFVSLDYGYGKDRLSAWHKAISFEVSDIQSLNVLDFQFVKDKNHVYIDCRKAVSYTHLTLPTSDLV